MFKEYDVIESFRGAPQGHTVVEFEKGQKAVKLPAAFGDRMVAEKKLRAHKPTQQKAAAE